MKVIELTRFGVENLRVTQRPVPQPRPGEVLVRIEAVSLNYLDLVLVRGTYLPDLPLPLVPASDGAGVVAGIGAGVSQWKEGDRVTVHYMQDWVTGELTPEAQQSKVGQQRPGVLAEYVTIPAHGLVRTPGHLSPEQASTLPIAGLTAWVGLVEYGKLQVGQTVLTQGTGGVSIAALQIARAAGARVIATSGSNEKLDKLRSLGADAVINYRQVPDWDREVKRLTGGRGVDITLDIAGAETLNQSVRAVKLDGVVGMVGFVSGKELSFDVVQALRGGVQLKGSHVGSRQSFENYVNALEINRIVPVIDKVFPVDQVQEAYQYLESGQHFGKVVIRL